ncbi:Crp/Fnr family transcriptional regulator [Vibrio panuliri]|uniref:Crp/Fnr family transcriptional regulator n=1 Tax=Vibrio panuliri TaxID=1381081 RepID=A0A1Q9H9A3_9VIBR|nr:Crp/Fnr family transcriptional regulator [Vibrio panuliri]OLQ85398.1 Crp/Fnr family transcriptional regulator [Vibrio panuliri]
MQAKFRHHLIEQGFSDVEVTQLTSLAKPLELPTRHILIEQGVQAESFYFVLNGLCHASYLTAQGKEFSKEFYWELDWIIGFESLIKQQPSAFLLETLTPCELMCLSIDTLKQWRSDNHPIYLKLVETQLMHKENKERFMLLYSAEQRYQLFCENFADLEQRLSDYQIAAYLGITPVSLSRIKNRAAE